MKKQYPGFIAIVFVMLFFAVAVEAAQNNLPIRKDESLRRGETKATLDPALFNDARVRKAYQAAKEIPWILDSIYCYCFCGVSFQHKSLLSCYVGSHAAM